MSVIDVQKTSPHEWLVGQSSPTPYRSGSALAPAAKMSAPSAQSAASALFKSFPFVVAAVSAGRKRRLPGPEDVFGAAASGLEAVEHGVHERRCAEAHRIRR